MNLRRPYVHRCVSWDIKVNLAADKPLYARVTRLADRSKVVGAPLEGSEDIVNTCSGFLELWPVAAKCSRTRYRPSIQLPSLWCRSSLMIHSSRSQ